MRRLFVCLLVLASLAACVHARGTSVQSTEVRTVHVNGVDLGYRIVGQGKPLLMIMGYAGTMDVWDRTLVDALAKSRQVILFDNRNVGYSATSPETVTISLMARDGLGLLEALHIERADVFGWSMGSVIAQEMALAQPDSVGKLILYGTSCDPGAIMAALKKFEGLTPAQFAALLFPAQWVQQHPDIYSRLPSPAIPASPEAIKRQHQAMATWPGTCDRVHALKDVMLVVGEKDTITPVEQSLALADKVAGAWVVRFKGAGHWLMYQTPDDLAEVVHSFLGIDQDLVH